MTLVSLAIDAAERGLVPDPLLRLGIRRMCAARLREETRADCGAADRARAEFIAWMQSGPIAPVPEMANRQHYEVPAEFFTHVLGPRRKYSCCLWEESTRSLADAEALALSVTCARAELADGQHVLELGCGWGSLSLWMAESYPRSRIVAVSNSASQRTFIEGEVARRGLTNLVVQTADMNDFQAAGPFDRIVSVEMFEHMRNYERLLERIADWLRPEGRLFVHIFTHRALSYAFAADGQADWMGRHFFTGGIMPAEDLFHHFQRHVKLLRQWRWDGRHYQRTANAWLRNLDDRRAEVQPLLAATYGVDADRCFHRWRMFFLACAELFGYARGQEWGVSHYLFGK